MKKFFRFRPFILLCFAVSAVVIIIVSLQGNPPEPKPEQRPLLKHANKRAQVESRNGTPSRKTPNGFWRKSRNKARGGSITQKQEEMIKQLEAIGYLTGSTKGTGRVGITQYDKEQVDNGFNVYLSGHMPGAVLMDMNGNEHHRWERGYFDIWPDSDVEKDNVNTQYWRRAHLFENGDILIIFEGLGIVKLDRHANVLWANPIKAHHDLQVTQNGDIWLLTREAKVLPRINKKRPVLEDYITILDKTGREKRRVSILKSFESSPSHAPLFRASKRKYGDIFHTNTVHLLDGNIAATTPAFASGNVLISILMFSTIAVLDMAREKIIWSRQGPFIRQHDPQVLENGHILLFNNHAAPKTSSIMEINPVTGNLEWEYKGTPAAPFYSNTCGTVRRLSNGNTLIVESDNGRAFEINPKKEIVWEFASPHRAGKNEDYVATLFDLIRLPRNFPKFWVNQ